jgi:hypothetical protein
VSLEITPRDRAYWIGKIRTWIKARHVYPATRADYGRRVCADKIREYVAKARAAA